MAVPTFTQLTGDITVASDAPEPSKVVHASETGLNAFSVVPPANIDFGLVAVPGAASKTIIPGIGWYGPTLVLSNTTDFSLSGIVPAGPGQWTLTFNPQTVGPHTTTLTIGSMLKCVLSPNTFTATGTGIVN